jgi:hypothetical protein
MPQSWDWTVRLTPVKIVAATALFVVSAALLMESSIPNPFIYFRF